MAVRNPLGPPVYPDPLSWAAAAPLGYEFRSPALLHQALTHRSAAGGGAGSNERLEFVGDRVLGLIVAEWLAERFPEEREGGLGPRLARLVSRPVLAAVADRIGLEQAINVAPGEARAGIKRHRRVLADTFEALLGALYLDGGLVPVRRFLRTVLTLEMEAQEAIPPKDPKTALQEWALARGLKLPAYAEEARLGPPHAPRFAVRVAVGGKEGRGEGSSKREAEQAAALDLLARLGS